MLSIGITGQNGFVGSHLYNRLCLLPDEFKIIPFDKLYFEHAASLENWVSQCDVVVHLAAMNRHPDQQVIHDTNVQLVEKLISALDKSSRKTHVLFSSSSQEDRDNLYGISKKTGRISLQQWAEKTDNIITGLIIPNVFGPFGKPFYNSVVATFCYQLCNGDVPKIDIDAQLKLIYVDEVVSNIISAIRSRESEPEMRMAHTSENNVSQILAKLNKYKELYLEKGIIPELEDIFSRNLFNTFRSYINYKTHFPVKYLQHTDNRGKFVELVKLAQGGQVSFSTTVPGITRGNHFHTRKIERFSVIKGKAIIQLRKYNTTEVLEFTLDGTESAYVDMPIWYTHNIKNIGEEELYTVFWINEFFDPTDPDTYMETV